MKKIASIVGLVFPGIPTNTIDGGREGGGDIPVEEQFDATDSHLGSQRALLIVLGVVGVKN